MKLCILGCSYHGVQAISIEDEDGGERITPSKCCGSWRTYMEWELTPAQWTRIAELATEAASK